MSNQAGEQATPAPEIGLILETLRAEVRARRLMQGGGEPSAAERELSRALDEIELHRVVSAHWPLLGRTLPQRAIALVRRLHATGVTLVVVEHIMEVIVSLTQRVLVFNQGHVIAEGAPRTVMADPQVIEAYLGRSRSGERRHRGRAR